MKRIHQLRLWDPSESEIQKKKFRVTIKLDIWHQILSQFLPHAKAGSASAASSKPETSKAASVSSSMDSETDIWVEHIHPMNQEDEDPPTKTSSEKRETFQKKQRNWRLRSGKTNIDEEYIDKVTKGTQKELFPVVESKQSNVSDDKGQGFNNKDMDDADQDDLKGHAGTFKDPHCLLFLWMHTTWETRPLTT